MIYAKLAAAVVIVLSSFAAGWTAQGWRWEAAEGRAAINAQAKARLQRQGAESTSVAYEVVREKIRTEYAPIKEEVERVVIQYRDRECFSPDGVRLVNDSVRAANHPGEPQSALPAPTGTP